jgi:hypothetical protein
MNSFIALHDHFKSNLTFEEAKAAAGHSTCCAATALLLSRYWDLLVMEHAVEQAAGYFERLEGLT